MENENKKCYIDSCSNQSVSHCVYDGHEYCEHCFDRYFSPCDDCGEIIYRNDMFFVSQLDDSPNSDRHICQNCHDNGDYAECNRCGNIYHYDDMDGDYCLDCVREMDEEEQIEEIQTPTLNTKSKEFQDTKEGSIITDKRKFSAEIECYPPSHDNYVSLIKEINTNFKGTGQITDGSLDNGGIELQTPILQGAKGQSYIENLSKYLVSNKFFVNMRTGLHIHLDGAGFTRETCISKEEIKNIEINFITNFNWSVYKSKEVSRTYHEFCELRRAYIESYPFESFPMTEDGGFINNFSIKYAKQVMGEKNVKVNSKEVKSTIDSLASKLISMLREKDREKYKMYLEEKTNDSVFHKIKKLFTVYYFADDFIMQILPHSRRNNKYCLPLWREFNLTQIQKLSKMEDFETIWYQSDDLHEIKSRKSQQKDSSRRQELTFIS